MQALRLAHRAPLSSLSASPSTFRCMATATMNPADIASTSTSSQATTPIPLSNIEAQWEKLGAEEQLEVHRQLEALQKKDWKELSIDEKKAAYYVAFGPHGPRTPSSPQGSNVKIIGGTLAVMGAAGLLFAGFRSLAPPPPKTMTKEWQEASNERGKEQGMNPMTGVASEGYKGKGFVTSK